MSLKMSDFRNADFWSAYFAFRPEKPKKKSDQFRLFYGIFNPEVAKSFRENVLSRGGTEAPMVLYKRFRGQEPGIDALLIRDGIKKEKK